MVKPSPALLLKRSVVKVVKVVRAAVVLKVKVVIVVPRVKVVEREARTQIVSQTVSQIVTR